MRAPQQVLLLAFCLLISTALVAQQPTKPKTKTDTTRAKTKTKTDAGKVKTEPGKTKVKGDTTGMATQNPTMKNPVVQDTTMQGSGGGMGDVMPYTATYSSQFTIGNPDHARMVLQAWKDWDEGNLDRNAAMFSDNVVMEMPDGMVVRGKDSLMVAMKQHRGTYTNMTSTVDLWMPLRSSDRNEDWVAIWGTGRSTSANGTVTTNRLQELWRINRDGKIDLIRQYTARPAVTQ